MKNQIDFKVSGRLALFTDPITKIGGEKYSYQIPTYQVLKGIAESIYWKPTIVWYIDRVRIMKWIRTETKSIKPLVYGGGNTLAIYTYLSDVEYHVQAHFEWNFQRDDLINDRNENKHFFVARRMIDKGGRRDIFLGTRECQGYVEPCTFMEGESIYDTSGELSYGIMFHGYNYPDETGKDILQARFWRPIMANGIIEFITPSQCNIIKHIKKMKPEFIQTIGLGTEELLDGYEEEEASL